GEAVGRSHWAIWPGLFASKLAAFPGVLSPVSAEADSLDGVERIALRDTAHDSLDSVEQFRSSDSEIPDRGPGRRIPSMVALRLAHRPSALERSTGLLSHRSPAGWLVGPSARPPDRLSVLRA